MAWSKRLYSKLKNSSKTGGYPVFAFLFVIYYTLYANIKYVRDKVKFLNMNNKLSVKII